MDFLIFNLKTIEKNIFTDEKITKITIPVSEMGVITVLPDHEDLITSIGSGELLITFFEKDAKIEKIFVDGGVAKVSNGMLEIFANTAELATNLQQAEIQNAIERAQKILQENPIDIDIAAIESVIAQENSKLKTLKKWGIDTN